MPAPALPDDPTFHEFASKWVRDNEGGWRGSTRADYNWQLSNHLLPFFAGHRLSTRADHSGRRSEFPGGLGRASGMDCPAPAPAPNYEM